MAALAGVLAAGLLGLGPKGDADAAAGDRALKLYNVHTNETATIVFKRNGRYDARGLAELNTFLRDWRKNQPIKMDPHLFDLIWEVYQQSGSRGPIHVICGYRSNGTNEMLRGRSRYTGVAKHSQHTLGKAMDFYIPDVPLAKLRAIGLRMQTGGVGFYPTSGSPFVHMDTGSVRHWPRMTREQLVRVFPDGKTIHIPSDGKPLPGYAQALAAYKARKAGGGEIMMASASPKKWSLFGSRDEESGDEEAAAPATAAAAPTAKPPIPAAPPAAEEAPAMVADAAPLPRPAPVRDGEAISVAYADDIPLPRPSPATRAVMQLASAEVPVPASAPASQAASEPTPSYDSDGVADMLAALDAKSAREEQEGRAAEQRIASAADAIADQVGGPAVAAPVMAYASATAMPAHGKPHIDAETGALVAGASAGQRVASLGGSMLDGAPLRRWHDPLATFTPASYGDEAVELLTRAGSTRQQDYAELEMPHPFALPHLFASPERALRTTFGRFAYEGLRTDRFAGTLTYRLGTMEFAAADTAHPFQTARR